VAFVTTVHILIQREKFEGFSSGLSLLSRTNVGIQGYRADKILYLVIFPFSFLVTVVNNYGQETH